MPDGSEYSALFDQLERRYGLPSGYLYQTAKIESGFNPNSHNEFSRADGLFQFIPSTAREFGLKYGRGPGSTRDPAASADAAARYALINKKALQQVLGRDPTAGELYVAHQQGTHGASALVANPTAPAGTVVPPRNISMNAGNPRAPAGQFVQQWSKKFPTEAMPFASDDELLKEIGGGGSVPVAAKADKAAGDIISDDDLIKEMSGPRKGITVPATPVKTITIPRKAQPGEEVTAKAAPAPAASEETPAQYTARVIREHQGSNVKDFGARSGAEFLRGMGDVADTIGTGIIGAGRAGANALSNVGAISPQTRQAVEDWAGQSEGRIATGQQAYDEAAANSYVSPLFRGAGQATAAAPLLRGVGGVLPAEAGVAFKALAERSPMLARFLQGAGIGAGSSALTSSTSDLPLPVQMALGGAVGGGLNTVLHPAIAAGAKYAVNKAKNLWGAFTESGAVNTASRLLQGDNPHLPVDAREIIPGSTPTLAEATGDPNIATMQRNLRDVNPKPFVELEKKNNEARTAFWERTTGTKQDTDAMREQLDEQAKAAQLDVFKPGQKADPQPVLDTIDGILSGSGGERTAVKTSLNKIRDTIEKSGTDPQKLYNSARKEIGDLLDTRNLDKSGQQASRELIQVRDALDQTITKAAPGFDHYIADYAAAAKPINAMEYLQGLNLTDKEGNITLGRVGAAFNQIEKGLAKGRTHPATSLTTEHLDALEALHSDLLRQSKTQSGITKGTSTYQRFMAGSKIPGGSPIGKVINPTTIGTAAGTWLGESLYPGFGGPLGFAGGAALGSAADRMVGNRNTAVGNALTYLLTNPEAFSPSAAAGRNNLALQYGVPALAAGPAQMVGKLLIAPSGDRTNNRRRNTAH